MIDWLKPTRHRREVMNDVASTPPQIYHRPHVTLTFDLLMSPWPLTSSCHLDLTCSCHLDLWPPHVTLTFDLLMSPWPLTCSCHLDLWPPHVTLTFDLLMSPWPPHVTLTSDLLMSPWPLASSCHLDLWPPHATLTFDLLTPTLTVSCPCATDPLFQLASLSVCSVSNYCLHKSRDTQTKGRTDGLTDRQVDNMYVSAQWRCKDTLNLL